MGAESRGRIALARSGLRTDSVLRLGSVSVTQPGASRTGAEFKLSHGSVDGQFGLTEEQPRREHDGGHGQHPVIALGSL